MQEENIAFNEHFAGNVKAEIHTQLNFKENVLQLSLVSGIENSWPERHCGFGQNKQTSSERSRHVYG